MNILVLLLGGVLLLGLAFGRPIESGDLLFLLPGLFLITKGAEELLRPQHQTAANILLALSIFAMFMCGPAVILSWFLG